MDNLNRIKVVLVEKNKMASGLLMNWVNLHAQ